MEIIEIPNKSAFKLNEVCSITGVKPYVLRFWESEFDEIEPMTSSTGQKLFSPRDVEVIAMVKDLLFNQKMSIEEARYTLTNRLENPIAQHSEESLEIDNHEMSTSLGEESGEIPPRIPSYISQNEESIPQEKISFQRMSLSDGDLEKLVIAKGLLQEIVGHQTLN